jgi:hypothetical protein
MDGSSTELVLTSDSGTLKTYRARVEGAVSTYYHYLTPNYWKVVALDGTTYYYGFTPASRQDFESGTKIFKWNLDAVVDTNNNCMAVTYDKSPGAGQIYLSRIDYTGQWNDAGHTCGSTTNSVTFLRTTGQDHDPGDGTMYTTNYAVTPSSLLTEIRTYTSESTNPVKTYSLTYAASNSSSHKLAPFRHPVRSRRDVSSCHHIHV